jgi:HAD superfamily hydrolase (TIGR01509 family)
MLKSPKLEGAVLPKTQMVRFDCTIRATCYDDRSKTGRMIKALLFDFDGLILETEEPQYLSWLEVYKSFNVPIPMDEYLKIIGTSTPFFDPYNHLEKALGRKLNWEDLEKKRQNHELELILKKEPQPGIVDYLLDAKRLNIKMAVASSSSRAWVGGHLERIDLLKYFDCLLTKDDVTRTKPDPELFLKAASALGVQPHEAIVLEDSPNGILAAQAAGIFCVASPTIITSQLPLGEPDLVLASLADLPLPALLEKVMELKRNGSLASDL